MRRRQGFTLVEMMVAFALILFILVIMTEAFTTALKAFRDLKGVGDLEERLRGATTLLRRDLAADHFEGKRRLSDPPSGWSNPWPPREGFFRVVHRTTPPSWPNEGYDSDGLPSRRSDWSVLHFTVKLRGNGRGDFFLANLPRLNNQPSPLFTKASNFFGHEGDTRYQDSTDTYSSQWAEVAYFVEPTGSANGATALYALYRSQFVLVGDNRQVNMLFNQASLDQHAEVSCQQAPFPVKPPPPTAPYIEQHLHFNTPSDVVKPLYEFPRWMYSTQVLAPRRAFNPLAPTPRAANLLLTDVISFDVDVLRSDSPNAEFEDVIAQFDTADPRPRARQTPVRARPVVADDTIAPAIALRVRLRVWDQKTRQTRQVTLIQDL